MTREDTCYYNTKKIILLPGKNENGKWVCEIRVPEFTGPQFSRYQRHSPGEHDTELHAKMAAFEYALKVINSSNHER